MRPGHDAPHVCFEEFQEGGRPVPRRVVVVAAVLLATGLVLAGRGAGASVPSTPRRAAGFDGRVRVAVGGTV